MKNTRILCVVPANDAHKEQLQSAAPGAQIIFSSFKDVTENDAKQADVIFGNINPSFLKGADSLKWLQLSSAGADAYTVPELLPEGVLLTNAIGAYGLTVSEHILTMLMCMNRRFPQYLRHQQEQSWKSAGTVKSVSGSTILVLGTGDIGGQFAAKAKALGAYTIGIRRNLKQKPDFLDEQYSLAALDEQLPRADVVVICLPLSQDTYHLFDARRLALMKKDALLINAGRGGIVDSDALLEALNNHTIGGACLDVTEPEPLPSDHELWKCDNIIITPHVAGFFFLPSTLDRIVDIACENIKRFLAGETLKNIV